MSIWPRYPSPFLLLFHWTPNLAHPGSLVLDEGVEEHDGEGKEKVEEQPDVDEGHLGGGQKYMIFDLVTFEELLVRLSETEIYRAARTIRQVKLTWQIIESLILNKRQVR